MGMHRHHGEDDLGFMLTREAYKNSLIEKLGSLHLDADKKDQHLLVNPEVIRDLVFFGEVSSNDVVLEIGSGPGNITEELAKRSGHVIAVEVDKQFAPFLNDLRRQHRNVEVIFGDVLQLKLPEFNKIVANSPFSVLEPMLQWMRELRGLELASLAIGKKYYNRVAARPGELNFTKTSLFTQSRFEPEFLRRLEKADFYPVAREAAIIMRLTSLDGASPLLELLSNFLSQSGGKSVQFLIENAGKHLGIKHLPTVLKCPQGLLSKHLQELNNAEISQLTKQLLNLESGESPI